MILIVDNSEERRNNLVIRLRVKGYLVCGINYDDIDYYTKPFMTVYVNPPRKMVDKLTAGDTISVAFTDRNNFQLPLWTTNIYNLKDLEKDIINIFNEKSTFLKKDKINVVGYACLRNDRFALGGKRISMSKMQMLVIKFFLFQKNKKFKLYEACQYMHFRTNPEENFARLISNINKRTKEEDRDKLIVHSFDEYYLNPDIANYVCKEDDDIDEVDEASGPIYIRLDLSYDI